MDQGVPGPPEQRDGWDGSGSGPGGEPPGGGGGHRAGRRRGAAAQRPHGRRGRDGAGAVLHRQCRPCALRRGAAGPAVGRLRPAVSGGVAREREVGQRAAVLLRRLGDPGRLAVTIAVAVGGRLAAAIAQQLVGRPAPAGSSSASPGSGSGCSREELGVPAHEVPGSGGAARPRPRTRPRWRRGAPAAAGPAAGAALPRGLLPRGRQRARPGLRARPGALGGGGGGLELAGHGAVRGGGPASGRPLRGGLLVGRHALALALTCGLGLGLGLGSAAAGGGGGSNGPGPGPCRLRLQGPRPRRPGAAQSRAADPGRRSRSRTI